MSMATIVTMSKAITVHKKAGCDRKSAMFCRKLFGLASAVGAAGVGVVRASSDVVADTSDGPGGGIVGNSGIGA